MNSTLGIQLHVSALYIGHRQVVLKLNKELYNMRVGCPGGERDLVLQQWVAWPWTYGEVSI
jgi:hypothetical protein